MSKGAMETVTANNDQTDEPVVQRDELFKLLGNERRRYVIQFLRQQDGESVTLGNLATYVAAQENNIRAEDVTQRQRKRVYTSLQQTHLPRMDEVSAVTFDKERGTIIPSDTLTKFTLYLDVVSANDIPESVVYLSTAALSVTILLAVLADVPFVNAIPAFGWATVILLLFGGIAAVQRYIQSQRNDAF